MSVAAAHPRIPHMPALDGLRAVALVTVLAFHAGFSWVRGGYLPLTSFFVLSGFLITALLLNERARTGHTALTAFWMRRVRRLAPAAVLGVALVGLYLAFGADGPVAGVDGDVVASLGWFANWRFILSDRVYADAFSDPSPLQHFWSLAVEEQFYLLLPLLFVGFVALGAGRRRWFVGAAGVLTFGSVVWMRVLHEPGDPPLRVYFGTDTRAAELLVGVLLACALVRHDGSLRRFGGLPRRLIGAGGALALVASVWSWIALREYDDRLYEGGLLLFAVLAAVVVTAATDERSLLTRVLSIPPLVWLGRISYGIYLFHWPIFLWLDADRVGLAAAPRFALQMGITVSLAWVSHRFIETPIRNGAWPDRITVVGWANASVGVAAAVVVAAAALPSDGLEFLRTGEEGRAPAPVQTEDLPGAVAAPGPPDAPVPAEASPVTVPVPDDPGPVPAVAASASVAPPASAPPRAAAGPPEQEQEPPPAPAAGPPPQDSAAPPPSAAQPTPAAPLRVMVVGDSLAYNLATGLRLAERDGSPVTVDDASVRGCTIRAGGVRYLADGTEWPVPDACDWWVGGLADRLATYRPDVLLVHTGANEVYDRTHPRWAGRKSIRDGGVAGWVGAEYSRLVDIAGAAGVPVAWMVPPCNRWRPELLDPSEAAQRLAIIQDDLVPSLAGAAVIGDLDAVLCPGGEFREEVYGVPDARPDGFHLRDVAVHRLVDEWLLGVLQEAAAT